MKSPFPFKQHGQCGRWVSSVFPHLATLDRYPTWMRLVHRVDAIEPDEGRPAWWVELRARVGLFTRSKQLRMVRTIHEPQRRVRFERVQPDERDHAAWVMTASTDPVPTGTRVIVEVPRSVAPLPASAPA